MGQQNPSINPEFTFGAKIMESAMDFGVKVTQILGKDSRYNMDAYGFVLSGLQYTLSKLDEHRHISGKELVGGIREYALKQYGPMARPVLEHWGIKNTVDFGEIVFNLVEAGLMKRRPEDSKEEFKNVFDFEKAFDKPYRRSISPKISSQKNC